MASSSKASPLRRALSVSLSLALCGSFFQSAAAAAKPDLVIARVSGTPELVVGGATMSATSTTKNRARTKTARSVTRFYLSIDGIKDKQDTRLIGKQPVPALRGGRSFEGTTILTIPTSIAPGVYRLLGCADDRRRVAESKEGNNCRADPTSIEVEAASSEALIDAALARGDLDEETALEYKVFSVFDDPRLPDKYHGTDDGFESDALVEAATSWDSLSPEAQGVLGPFLIPPFYEGSYWQPRESSVLQRPSVFANAAPTSPWCLAVGSPQIPIVTQAWSSLDTANGKIRVWWQNRFSATDEFEAQKIVDILDRKVYGAVTGLMGREPIGDDPTSACDGGSAALDIALVDVSKPTTIPDSGCANTSTHMIFPRTLPGSWRGELPYVAHELMHAVQYGMTLGAGTVCGEYAWMREATAQWIQDYISSPLYGFNVPPDNTEQDNQAPDIFFKSTEVPLETLAPPTHHDYASYVFFFFLARQSSPAIVADVWAAAQANNTLKSLEAVSGGAAGLRTLWKQFVLFNWNQGSVDHYKDWDNLTQTPELTDSGALPKGETSVSVSVDHLSAKYFTFTPADALTSLEFTNDQPSIEGGGIQAVITYKDGTDKIEDWSDEDKVVLCLEDPEVKEITLIFSNGNAVASNKVDFHVKWNGLQGLCCTTQAPPVRRHSPSTATAAASCPVTGTISWTETYSNPGTDGGYAETEQISGTIDVSMKDDGFGTGFLDDGSSYSLTYSRDVSGNDGFCDYHASWSGMGAGLVEVGSGKLVEPGDFSLITNGPSDRRELLVGVNRSVIEYTYTGSETFSNCENPESNGTNTFGADTRDADDLYFACEGQSTTGYLEFTGPESSTTLNVNCSFDDGNGTTWTLQGMLQLPG